MRSHRMIFGMALLGLFCLPAPSVAQQELSGVAVGDRVKLRVGGETVVGFFDGIAGGAIGVRDEMGPEVRSYDLPQLTRLQVHRGTKRATKRGLVLGVVGGVLVGALHGSTRSICNHCSGDAAGVEMILFGLLGVPVGAFVGSRFSIDVWENVTMPAGVGGAPGFPGRIRMRVSIPYTIY